MTALLDAFTARLETVFDLSRNSYNKDMTAQTQKLDNTEAERILCSRSQVGS